MIRRHTKLSFCLLLAACISIFSSFIINKFAPDTMGLSYYVAMLMEKGAAPYKDFMYYLPPGSLIRSIWCYGIFGKHFLAFRIIGITGRIAIAILLFILLSRFFEPLYAFISVMCGSILVYTTSFDLLGDYNQTYRFYLLLGTYCGVKALEVSSHKKLWSFLGGFCLGWVFLYKHSAGFLVVVACFIILTLFSIVEKQWKYFIKGLLAASGFLVAIAGPFIWLAAKGAFIPFVRQIIYVSAAKGETSTVFLRFWNNIARPEVLIIFLCCLLGYTILNHVNLDELKKNNSIKFGGIFCLGLSVFAFFSLYQNYIVKFLSSSSKTQTMNMFLLAACFSAFIITRQKLLAPVSVDKNNSGTTDILENDTETDQQQTSYQAVFLVLVLIFCFYYLVNLDVDQIVSLYKGSSFMSGKESLTLFSAYFVIVSFAASCWRYIVLKKKVNKAFLLVLTALLVMLYESGMSTGTSGLTYITATASFPFAICCLFMADIPYKKIKDSIVLAGIVIMVLLSFSQKISDPYSWWDSVSNPIDIQNLYKADVPSLEGFVIDKRTANKYQEVYKLIEENTNEGDYILSFPHLLLYNVITDRVDKPTFSISYYFDICSDKYALDDLKIIKNNPPKMIIMYDYRDDFWEYNEARFRNNEKSGQRYIMQWLSYEVLAQNYVLVGKLDTLNVYLKSDSDVKYTYFEVDDELDPLEPIKKGYFSPLEAFSRRLGVNMREIDHIRWTLISLMVFIYLFFLMDKATRMTCLLIATVVFDFVYPTNVWFSFLYPLLLFLFDERERAKWVFYLIVLSLIRIVLSVFMESSGYFTVSYFVQFVHICIICITIFVIMITSVRNRNRSAEKQRCMLHLVLLIAFVLSQMLFSEVPWFNWLPFHISVMYNNTSLIFGNLGVLFVCFLYQSCRLSRAQEEISS